MSTHTSTRPAWALGPFERPVDAQPVIRPNPLSRFICPLAGTAVAWESKHTFNPAAVVRDGRVHLLYRAEDGRGKGGIGGYTSRLGLATSDDGIHFTCEPAPVLFPAHDDQREREWTGGCEDPRLVEAHDGTYILTYTQYAGHDLRYRLGLATSRDLRTWTKLGCPFRGTADEGRKTKSGAIVQEWRDGRLVAARINGRYWMYVGVYEIDLASSDDLLHWTLERTGILRVDPTAFDSDMVEAGCPPILTPHGIVVVYNGVTTEQAYVAGQALFDARDPSRLVDRLPTPSFAPALPWEKTGQYAAGTTFVEGLVLFRGRWHLYYGCADSFVGVAVGPQHQGACP